MPNADKSSFSVRAEDILRYDWDARLAEHPLKRCWSYYEVFVQAGKECETAGDEVGRRVYALLYAISSFRPNFDNKGNAFGPRWRGTDGDRAMMAEDLAESDLLALRGVLEHIGNPEFRARVGDVLWESKRDYQAAQIAVRAYLESAECQKTDDLWTPYVERLERAAQLAAKIGFGKPLHREVLTVVERAIDEFKDNPKSGSLCHRLIMLAFEHDAIDTSKYAALCERMANDFAAAGNWDNSEHYWQLAARLHRKAKNQEDTHRCQVAAAECLISSAEARAKDKRLGASNAAHWVGRGLEALRQAKADPTRIKAVHLQLLELQRESLKEMRLTDIDVDGIPDFREIERKTRQASADWVSGLPFQDAFARLALIAEPLNTVQARASLESDSEAFVWDQVVSSVALDRTGKIADTMPTSGSGESDTNEEYLRKKMVLHARDVHWPLYCAWKIEPARETILSEHGIRFRDFFWLVDGNPFIPPGHEGIYIRGLQAGFYGDWLVATHLLIPQLEASIRHVLQRRGVVTSTLESDSTQKEKDLNQLLWMPEVETVFGPDITFELRGILIERFGHNMRNEFAHGLMPEGAFYQPASVYLWWLILRLCWHGFACVQNEH